MKLIFRIGDTLQVVSKSATSNDKIEENKKRKIVQTYTFSRQQFESIANQTNSGMREFFSKADTNCLDCPFNEFGKCYTHKFNQYVGFISMLKSIAKTYPQWDDIPTYDANTMEDVARTMAGGEDISWDVTFYDRDNSEQFVVNVRGDFENEEDAIKRAIYENNVFVDDTQYGTMYWGQNEVDVYGAKRNYDKPTFVRFGTYGEPSLHPIEMIEAMVNVADNWTGYTHQWRKSDELGAYFMASTHTLVESEEALTQGYRSYIATPTKIDEVVNCPASKESDYKSSCSKCGLCSGTQGKGKKSIYILNH